MSRDLIEAVKEAVGIAEVLTHFGHHPARDGYGEVSYRCPLPGHEDKTPNFFVNKGEQLWHCFGCSRGGDVITLVEVLEDLPRWEGGHQVARPLRRSGGPLSGGLRAALHRERVPGTFRPGQPDVPLPIERPRG